MSLHGHLEGKLAVSMGTAVETSVPPFHVVVGSDTKPEHTPAAGGPEGTVDPIFLNVVQHVLDPRG